MRNLLRLGLAALMFSPLIPVARAAGNDVKVGAVVSFSGYMAPYDTPPLKSALLAVDELNAKGGLLGRKIVVTVDDAKTDRALTARLARDLMAKHPAMLIVACDYDEGAPAAIAAIEQGTLAFSLCASDPKMGPQGLGPLAFSAATGAGNFAYSMAEWGYKTKGWRHAYTLTDTSTEVHKAGLKYFELAWRQLPGTSIVASDTFLQDDPSIASQISKIKALGKEIDFLWVSSHNPGFASALRQIRAAGITLPIMTTDALDGDYWISAAPHLSDVYYAAYCSIFGDDPRPRVRQFLIDYTKKYGNRPDACYALPGYTLIESWALAVDQAKSFDTKAVAAEMEKFKEEPFLAGKTTYTSQAHLQLNREVIVMQIQDGKFSAIEPYHNSMIPPLDYRNVK
jgi:branched-chain amino acid transport system substrate-binding protein